MQCPQKCKGCPTLSNPIHNRACYTRVQEWVKNIEVLCNNHHSKGEGESMAEEIIHYMKHDFMEGY